MMSAHEIPRWRFVAKAKKTEGYSSQDAGTIVPGLSAEELAGRYYHNHYNHHHVPRERNDETQCEPIEDDYEQRMHQEQKKQIGKLNLYNDAEADHDEVIFEYHTGRKGTLKEDADDKEHDNSRHHHSCNDERLDQVEKQELDEVEQQNQEQQNHQQQQQQQQQQNHHQQQQQQQHHVQQLEVEVDHSVSSKHSKECNSIISSSSPQLRPSLTEPKLDASKPLHFRERHSKKMKLTMAIILFLTLLAIILGITLDGSGRELKTTDTKEEEEELPDRPALTSTLHSTEVPSYSPSPIQQQPQQQPPPPPTSVPISMSSTVISPKPDSAMVVTISPTYPSTDLPTMSIVPSPFPTFTPTCETNYNDFNLCIAIDMSGSVCNGDTGFECYACEPETICLESIDTVGDNKATCCNNFYDVIEFSKLMISSLERLPVNRSYSLVSFGNNATLDLDLASPEETLTALDGLVYTGGKTNHAAAISTCHTSLLSSAELGRKNIMLLITDGYPSEPEDMPRAYAEAAATAAKSDGVFIVPITIRLQFTPEPTPYLQRISSDGTALFDVTHFDVLAGLEEDLLAQVSCLV